jgi:hypothetical protein
MPSSTQLAIWEGVILLAGFIGIVLWKLTTGSIRLNYLLYGEARRVRKGAGYSAFFSPGRAQMLMTTVVFAGYYLLQVIQDPTHFPDVPDGLLAVLAGSHAVYLGGKAQSLYLGRARDLIASLNRRTP